LTGSAKERDLGRHTLPHRVVDLEHQLCLKSFPLRR